MSGVELSLELDVIESRIEARAAPDPIWDSGRCNEARSAG
jgi:hypothetical protein